MNMRSKQSGFTLIEIAIVLVIIGLLLGGVLKGQELINSAKIKNLINDLNGISTAVYAYQDRYRALPGDDAGATRWPQITSAGTGLGDGNGALAGKFNEAYVATAAPETILFWTELRLAGLIGGNVNEGVPLNAVGGILGVQQGAGNGAANVGNARTQGFGGLVACQTNVLGKIAEAMDRQLDDGVPNTGGVKAWAQTGLVPIDGTTTAVDLTYAATGTTAVSPAAGYVDDGTTMYTVCKHVL
jgi:prepilin-type N-terminal cleavage/methylation domain-containing protein